MNDLADARFVARFEDTTLPEEAFHHADHVRLAWLYLRREPLLLAAAHFRAGLQRFARAKGRPGLYHETITLGFLLLIHERMRAGEAGEDFVGFAAANPDLLHHKPSALDAFYSPETLSSEAARRNFVLPEPAISGPSA